MTLSRTLDNAIIKAVIGETLPPLRKEVALKLSERFGRSANAFSCEPRRRNRPCSPFYLVVAPTITVRYSHHIRHKLLGGLKTREANPKTPKKTKRSN